MYHSSRPGNGDMLLWIFLTVIHLIFPQKIRLSADPVIPGNDFLLPKGSPQMSMSPIQTLISYPDLTLFSLGRGRSGYEIMQTLKLSIAASRRVYSNRGTWKKIIQSQRFLKTTDSQVFCCERTNNIRKFEGCFLRRQVISNGFKVFNGCIAEASILLILFAKKKPYDWIIFFQVPQFEQSHCEGGVIVRVILVYNQ